MNKESVGALSRTVSNIRCPACEADQYKSELAIYNLIVKRLGIVIVAACSSPRCGKIYQFTLPDSVGAGNAKPSWKHRRAKALYVFAVSLLATYAIIMTVVAASP